MVSIGTFFDNVKAKIYFTRRKCDHGIDNPEATKNLLIRCVRQGNHKRGAFFKFTDYLYTALQFV